MTSPHHCTWSNCHSTTGTFIHTAFAFKF